MLIHGTSSSALVGGGAVDELAELGRVITYDRRGCARNERPEPYDVTSVSDRPTPGSDADDARALLRALDAEPAVVVGRSYGGSVALDLATRHPESVRALVLLEAFPSRVSTEADSWGDSIAARLERIAAERGVDAVGEAFIREVLGEWEGLPEELREMFVANGPAILAEFRGDDLLVEPRRPGRAGVRRGRAGACAEAPVSGLPPARRISRRAVAGMKTFRTPTWAIRSSACSGSNLPAR